MKKNHHIIINGCSNSYTANGGLIDSTGSFNCNDKKILYAWALNSRKKNFDRLNGPTSSGDPIPKMVLETLKIHLDQTLVRIVKIL